MNEVMRTMLAHRSVRRFTDEAVGDERVAEAVRAGQAASSSSAVWAYSVIRVRDAAKRAAIAELAGPQEKVVRCGAFLVVCGDSRRHRLACARAGVAYAETFENFLVSVVDAALFAQNMALAFESMGYGVCFVGGVRNDLGRVRALLALPEGVYPFFGLCVGLPADTPSMRPRPPVDAVLFDDAYPDDGPLMGALEGYDDTYRAYLAARGAGPSGWTGAMVAKHGRTIRPGAGAFYASQGATLG